MLNKIITLSVSFVLFAFSVSALSQEARRSFYLDKDESLQRLVDGFASTPAQRLDAKIKFNEPIDRKGLSDWVNSRAVEVLELKGKLTIGEKVYTVFLKDLGGYEGSFDEILYPKRLRFRCETIEIILSLWNHSIDF